MKPNHKDLRFLIYENRELKFLYAINVHSESMNHALFLLRGRTFPCQAQFFYFMVETWCGASLGFLLTHRMPWHGPLAAPTSPAPGRDSTGSAPHSLHSLFLMGVCDMLLRHYSISICLYTGALAYCIYRLQQQFKRLCRAGEAMHSGELCAVGNRPITCLMKAVRRQIWRFASPHSDTMG